MNNFRIDLRGITERSRLHDCIAQSLPLPSYYGRNLDALYDVLCDFAAPTALLVLCDGEPSTVVSGAVKAMRDAADCNPRLSVELWRQ